MPGLSNEELITLAGRVHREELHPDVGTWYQALDPEEQRTVVALAVYWNDFAGRRKREQRRALRLFRSWLTAAQRAELASREFVTVIGTAGGRYRIWPYCGWTAAVERHGKNWYHKRRFCYHDDIGLPKADVALAHLLQLQTDEPAFLAAANMTVIQSQMWDGQWRRRLNAARRLNAQRLAAQVAA